MLLKPLKNFPEVVHMIIKSATKDNNVVQVDLANVMVQTIECSLHVALVCRWCILQPERDPNPFV